MAEAGASHLPSLAQSRPGERFPIWPRLTERRFWVVQSLVFTSIAIHYISEVLGATDPYDLVHALAVTAFVIPLTYAALNYGWEGAALTNVWGVLLVIPSMVIFHRGVEHWGAESIQLATMAPVGLLVAWRVGHEKELGRQAQKRAAALELLNDVGAHLRESPDDAARLRQVLKLVVDHLNLEHAWLILDRSPILDGDADRIVSQPSEPPEGGQVTQLIALHNLLSGGSQDVIVLGGRGAAVPVTCNGEFLGSLGVRARRRRRLEAEEISLLGTVAGQVGVATRNAQLQRAANENLRSYAQQVTQAQEEERLRIARELHDSTAQELIQLVRTMEGLRESGQPPSPDEIGQLADEVRTILEGVRWHARNLRPSILDDLGLVAAIKMMIRDADHLKMKVSLQVQGTERRCEPATELALFRIAQEALNNVAKHAEATEARVTIIFEERSVTVEIADNGKGFRPLANVRDNAPLGKLGLIGMAERADLVGGKLSIDSDPERGGTTVRVTVGA